LACGRGHHARPRRRRAGLARAGRPMPTWPGYGWSLCLSLAACPASHWLLLSVAQPLPLYHATPLLPALSYPHTSSAIAAMCIVCIGPRHPTYNCFTRQPRLAKAAQRPRPVVVAVAPPFVPPNHGGAGYLRILPSLSCPIALMSLSRRRCLPSHHLLPRSHAIVLMRDCCSAAVVAPVAMPAPFMLYVIQRWMLGTVDTRRCPS